VSEFTLKRIDTVKGKQKFDQLEINGNGQLDAFEEALKGTHFEPELNTLFVYMEYVANNRTLPSTKFRDITPAKEQIKEYGFKSKHLRIYVIQQRDGKIVVPGGLKSTQEKDIRSLRALKKQYLSTLKLKER